MEGDGSREGTVTMAKMVDVGEKEIVKRMARAEGRVFLKAATLDAISSGRVRKGDVMTASKLAGIQAAKATSSLLPLCHQIPLTSVEVELAVESESVLASCTVSAEYRTGVEMEALVGVTTALLNVWDMVKYLEKDEKGQYPSTQISEVRVTSKVKGGG